MSTTADVAQSTKVITSKVRLSYLHAWEPVAIEEGQDKKYSACLLIPKSDKALVAELNKAINAAKEQGKAKFGGKIPTTMKTPLRDGDVERPDDENYAGCYFINANAKTKPGIVDKNIKPILNQDELYSGCYARVSITFYAFNTSGNKGVACGLNHIMKVEDGEPLGGRSSVEDDFGAFAENAEADFM